MVQGNPVARRGGGEDEQRFSHLIQPIRDLTKNWDVDIAAQLEDYLEEVSACTMCTISEYVRGSSLVDLFTAVKSVMVSKL